MGIGLAVRREARHEDARALPVGIELKRCRNDNTPVGLYSHYLIDYVLAQSRGLYERHAPSAERRIDRAVGEKACNHKLPHPGALDRAVGKDSALRSLRYTAYASVATVDEDMGSPPAPNDVSRPFAPIRVATISLSPPLARPINTSPDEGIWIVSFMHYDLG